MFKTQIASRYALIAVAPMLGLLASGPASAQIWIGQIVGNMIAQQQAAQKEAACMGGAAMPDSEVAETRESAFAAMSGYWNAVRGGAPADVAAFYQGDRKVSWKTNNTVVGGAGLHRITDPLAQQGAAFDTRPVAYVRSGDGSSVHGQWAVRRADGQSIGTLDAAFRRADGAWKLSDLTVYPATDYVEPLVQYCHKVGDVLPYRVASTTQAREYLVKRADRLKAKADKAMAAADAAATRHSDAAAIQEKRAGADAASAKFADAQREALAATAANEQALSDAKAADAARSAAMAALKR